MNKNIAIRADASDKIGTGHIIRMTALGQAFKDKGFDVHFITICRDKSLLARLKRECFFIHNISFDKSYDLLRDVNKTVEICRSINTNTIVTDGYKFTTFYQKKLKNFDFKLACIDDISKTHFVSDLVINQNINADKIYNYSCEPYTKLLLGTKFIMLRSEFLKLLGWKRVIKKDARRILISLGGSDNKNMTLEILKFLESLREKRFNINVILGSLFRNVEKVNNFVNKSKNHDYKIFKNVEKMSAFMQQADLAITTGGSTVWEMAFLQTPMVVGISASNQQKIVNELNNEMVAYNIGWFSNLQSSVFCNLIINLINNLGTRISLSKRAGEIVDGNGAARVVNEIIKN